MDRALKTTELPGDFFSFEELKDDFPELTSSDWKLLAASVGIEIKRYRVEADYSLGRRMVYGLNWEDIEKIEQYFEIPNADDSIVSAFKLAKELRMRKKTLLEIADRHKIPYEVYVFSNMAKGEGFLGERAQAIRDLIYRDRGSEIEQRLKNDEVPSAPAGYSSIKRHARSRRMTERILLDLCEGAGVIPERFRIRGVPTLCLSEDQIKALETAYEPEKMQSLLPVSIRKFAKQNRIKTQDVINLANGAEIKLRTYYFGSKQNLGLMPKEVERIKQTYSVFDQVPFSTEDISPLGAIAKREKIDLRTLRKLLDGTDIEVGVYRFPNGKDLPGLSKNQVSELKLAYSGINSRVLPRVVSVGR